MKLIISAMLVVAIACAPQAATPTSSATPSSTVAAGTTTPATAAATQSTAATGSITGLAGYPAEGHPAMTIYAVSSTDRSVFFSVAVPRGTDPKPTYTITGVRPGTYALFAYLDGNDGPAGGAYTQYVKCGLNASCSDHTIIDVVVRSGETVRDIDVTDWYAPQGTFPPRPR